MRRRTEGLIGRPVQPPKRAGIQPRGTARRLDPTMQLDRLGLRALMSESLGEMDEKGHAVDPGWQSVKMVD